ncbi:MAG: glycosyltransferase [Candidatus Auribacterota bacterium]|jgi:glycosyltransferase involved in cell wall biosynthesis|nr:glycosyltransferase [Candidatus Auribacterota bacterium]
MKKVAIIHDWLTGMRGGEKCLELFCNIFPQADIFTLLHIKGSVSPAIESHPIFVSFIQNMPFVKKKYRHYLPLFPSAIENFDLTDYDLVLSSSHCVAKGVIPGVMARHVCYCYTPMRYAWDMRHHYFPLKEMPLLKRRMIPMILNHLRMWDITSNSRVDEFIAISGYVARRIERNYGRQASVIYPPVDTEFYTLSEQSEDFYLIVSALAPYKRVDLAIATFNELGFPLVIIGTGQDEKRLRKMAGSNIRFMGWMSDDDVRSYYQHCRAFIFPGEEDFGITPLEAMACGKPVVAYRRGGATETVAGYVPGRKDYTGVFFNEQTVDSLKEAVLLARKLEFFPVKIREHAEKFAKNVFVEQIKQKFKAYLPE